MQCTVMVAKQELSQGKKIKITPMITGSLFSMIF